MERVLVSSCLIGEKVRYDGSAATCTHPLLDRWRAEGRIVPFCPELAGGLGTPRPPAERAGGDRVLARDGEDLTSAFAAGAEAALALCADHGLHVAVLKERSPSCGSTAIHDGSFTGALQPGQGITTELLRAHGVAVFPETALEQAQACLGRLEEALSCPDLRHIE